VSELRPDLRHGDAFADLHARVAVPEIVRREVCDAGALAGPAHRVPGRVRGEAGEHTSFCGAVLRRTGLLHVDHQPRRDGDPAPRTRRLPVADTEARTGYVNVSSRYKANAANSCVFPFFRGTTNTIERHTGQPRGS
jgi:hypothetical protein